MHVLMYARVCVCVYGGWVCMCVCACVCVCSVVCVCGVCVRACMTGAYVTGVYQFRLTSLGLPV